MQPLEQIAPQVARGKFDELLWTCNDYMAEEKLDGERFKMHIFENGNRFDSRTISKKTDRFTEKTDNVPHLRDIKLPRLAGTILDGEIKFGGDSMSTSTIMGCLPEEAVKRQQEAKTWVKYYVFDIIKFKGEDVRHRGYAKRREMLLDVIGMIRSSDIRLPDYTYDQKKQFCEKIFANGGEGVILKNLRAPYTEKMAWIKVKAVATFDVVIMGYEEATPETIKKGDTNATISRLAAQGWIGAVVFGQYVNGKLKKFGRCSGMPDDIRAKYSEDKAKYIGRVIKIEAQSRIHKTGYFRHPRFSAERPDKDAKQCIYWENES